jgi:peptide deformylase
MPIRPIVQLGNPRLREIASPVKDPKLPEVSLPVKDLADTLAHWRTRTGYGRASRHPSWV